MKNSLIKPVIRVGNSAGVLVPKEWINGSARVELIEKPLNIKKDILDILSPCLEDIEGIYLTGSYARGEQTGKSDVDVLVITSKISKRIKKGKYDILLIKKDDVDNEIKNSALPLIPMLKEARPMMGKNLLEEYRKAGFTKKNLEWYMAITASAIKINTAMINLSKEQENKHCSDAVSYSLILNLRSIYIVDCMKKGIKWTSNGLLSMIKKISGSLKAYEGYLAVKNNESVFGLLPIDEAEKLLHYITKRMTEHKKWLKAKKE